MTHPHKALFAALIASALAGHAMAQTAAPMVDCDTQFAALDTDKTGTLSEAEAPREYARARVETMTLKPEGIDKATLMAQCKSAMWSQDKAVEGAPMEGANSFTEAQAKDRALSWNLTGVSALTLDDKGIWRGTAMKDKAEVAVSVDYKGNVTTTPKS